MKSTYEWHMEPEARKLPLSTGLLSWSCLSRVSTSILAEPVQRWIHTNSSPHGDTGRLSKKQRFCSAAAVLRFIMRVGSRLMFSFEPLVKQYWFGLITLSIWGIHFDTLNVPVNHWSVPQVRRSYAFIQSIWPRETNSKVWHTNKLLFNFNAFW